MPRSPQLTVQIHLETVRAHIRRIERHARPAFDAASRSAVALRADAVSPTAESPHGGTIIGSANAAVCVGARGCRSHIDRAIVHRSARITGAPAADLRTGACD